MIGVNHEMNILLGKMTLEEKLGQMFMARGFKFFTSETDEMIKAGMIGGMHVRSNDSMEEIENAQQNSKVPMFMASDMEAGFCGGNFKGTRFGCHMGLGSIGSEEVAYEFGTRSAREARAFGVNFVFGPVVDMANEPANPFTNIRSLGSKPEKIVRLAAAEIRGYQDNGMIVSAKHYPGAGRGVADSHIEPLILKCSREEFENNELFIYRELIKKVDLSGVMTGHIGVDFLDGECPATLSPKITSELFALGFNGLLITDSLAMKGVKGSMTESEVFARALEAGHDIILGDYNISPKKQFEYMLNAVQCGRISKTQIDRSVKKILAAKERIARWAAILPDYDATRDFAGKYSRGSIAVLGNAKLLDNARKEKTLFIVAQEQVKPTVIGEIVMDTPASSLIKTLMDTLGMVEVIRISDNPSPAEIEKTLDNAIGHDRIVFVAYSLIHSYKGTADFSKPLISLIRGLRRRIEIFITIGNPFAAREVPEFPCRVFTFDNSCLAEKSISAMLAGSFRPTGRLPVSW